MTESTLAPSPRRGSISFLMFASVGVSAPAHDIIRPEAISKAILLMLLFIVITITSPLETPGETVRGPGAVISLIKRAPQTSCGDLEFSLMPLSGDILRYADIY
ncbi:hypothetical protein [Janthinobacterium lividum]|uniref:hypothetical protein n=1 Tax=Janthinobacterium lividum TaxID=29581 RepID=UPI002092B7DE|nr:hypothetical protein [Janthinobacterium lividum]